ncbi:transposase [Burkholderia sp. AW33-5]
MRDRIDSRHCCNYDDYIENRDQSRPLQSGVKCWSVALERTKAQIRARVEHPFHVVKNLFRHRKVRYKGLLKNTAQRFSLFAFR